MDIIYILDASPSRSAELLATPQLYIQCKSMIKIIGMLENNDVACLTNRTASMWLGYTDTLKQFFNLCLIEWVKRGKSTHYTIFPVRTNLDWPWWFAWKPLHHSHQAAFVRSYYNKYSQIFTVAQLDDYMQHGLLWPHEIFADVATELYGGIDKVTHLKEYQAILQLIQLFSIKTIQLYTAELAGCVLKLADCKVWLLNRENNPVTGRPIKIGGPIYKDFERAALHYGLTKP
jgi:hypothetical protein